MTTFQKLIAGICILSIPFFNACGKDDPASCNYATEVQDEANALTNAATAFGNDPSTANCNAYKAAYQDYLDALEDHDNCVPDGQENAYQQAIDDARDALNMLQC